MSADQATRPRWRIGELSRRTGVSDHLLRAWERRYGLVEPGRSDGGFRLYSGEDEHRVRRMVQLLESGLAPAEAARIARASAASTPRRPASGPADGATVDEGVLARAREDLHSSVRHLDDAAAHRVVDGLLAALTVEAVLRDVLLPFLHDIGERWGRGEASIAEEHFASQLLRGRIAALAAATGGTGGPKALLACPPGERHDIALLAFGATLARQGWTVTFLGADTPLESVGQLLDEQDYEAVCLSAVSPRRFMAETDALARIGRRTRLVLAGPGATPRVIGAIGAEPLDGDPVTAARNLAASMTGRARTSR